MAEPTLAPVPPRAPSAPAPVSRTAEPAAPTRLDETAYSKLSVTERWLGASRYRTAGTSTRTLVPGAEVRFQNRFTFVTIDDVPAR
jgi:hypothetical protein